MAFHIVTNRCFLACDKVTTVVIEEVISEKQEGPRRKRKKSKKSVLAKKAPKAVPVEDIPRQFLITISYYPISVLNSNGNGFSQNSRGDPTEYTLDVRVFGKKEAYALYAEIIKEVQEQHPNDGYLDKLVTNMLAGTDFKMGEPDKEPIHDLDER